MSKSKLKLHLDSVLSFTMVAGLFLLSGLFFDFYYDLNDDVLLKDIVSGAYSGSPDAHSIQMLYPLSFIISLFYQLIPVLPWQGIFLCGCHGVCFYLIAKRSLSFAKKKWAKVVLLVTEAALVLTLFLWEFVVVQYTITAALLAACACFLVFTQPMAHACLSEYDIQKKEVDIQSNKNTVLLFVKDNIVAIVLVVLAYNVRSEMLLLMSPFIALSGILKWSLEKKVFAKETIKKYLSLIGAILLGMGLSLVVDMLAYCGKDWKEFRDFFDARTRVYDYTWYPEYEEAEEFYRGIGMTPGKVELIDNYNFGLDESIDAETLWSIAEYADETDIKEPLINRLKAALVDYKWRTFHEQDAPYNFIVLTAYGMVAALALVFKDKSALWKLPLAVIFRTIPWMYVILANRVPARISHPLYYIDLIILCAWMFSYYQKNEDRLGEYGTTETGQANSSETVAEDKTIAQKYVGCQRSLAMCVMLLLMYALIQLPNMWQKLDAEMERRESVNTVMQAFDAYAEANPDNYYYMDVYSTVDFSEKMFADVDNSQKNYDILGGWASGSPLQKQSTAKYHKDMLSRAELLLQDNFYFVIEEGRDISFLEDFYRTFGIVVTIEHIAAVTEQGVFEDEILAESVLGNEIPVEGISEDESVPEDRTLVIYRVVSQGTVRHE